jgi:alpha-D-ribose 1-methylphosphonate 5-triphosphate synthase subunit PhnH
MKTIDSVHDIQQAYRHVLDAMSTPGLIIDWTEFAQKLHQPKVMSPSAALLALILLDTETSFAVVAGETLHSSESQQVLRWINEMTYARIAPIDQAQFLFILADTDSLLAAQALSQANLGTLLNPHESATVIVETQAIAQSPADQFILKGPGIKHEQVLAMRSDWQWQSIRSELNREYPLGVDMMFVDRNHQLVCLPRTTQISQQEAK